MPEEFIQFDGVDSAGGGDASIHKEPESYWKQFFALITLENSEEDSKISDPRLLLKPFAKKVFQYLDENNDGTITLIEAQNALKSKETQKKLGSLICQHESEWVESLDRWRYIEQFIPEAKRFDWNYEKEKIQELAWWDEVKCSSVSDFPSGDAFYFHPAGLVGNFLGQNGGCLTVDMMKKIFNGSRASEEKLKQLVDELNSNLVEYKLDNCLRLAHFFAQVRQEVGAHFTVVEGFTYSKGSSLKETFGYFQRNPNKIKEYTGVTSASKQKELANLVYSTRKALGNKGGDDGWNYRGRGLKMTTGRYNYSDFTKNYKLVWSDEPKDFVQNPDLLAEMKYAIRSAVFYWLHHKLYEIADSGTSNDVVDKITAVINIGTKSYPHRQSHFRSIIKNKVFEPCC